MSKVYRINEFAKRIGRAPSTVRRWEREGILAKHGTGCMPSKKPIAKLVASPRPSASGSATSDA